MAKNLTCPFSFNISQCTCPIKKDGQQTVVRCS